MKQLISGPILQRPISSPVSAGNGCNEAVSKEQIDAFSISHSMDGVQTYCIAIACRNQRKSVFLLQYYSYPKLVFLNKCKVFVIDSEILFINTGCSVFFKASVHL